MSQKVVPITIVKAAVVKPGAVSKAKTALEIIREARGEDGAEFDPAVRGSFPSNMMPAPSSAAIDKAKLERTKLQTNEQPSVGDFVRAATAEALRAQAEAGRKG